MSTYLHVSEGGGLSIRAGAPNLKTLFPGHYAEGLSIGCAPVPESDYPGARGVTEVPRPQPQPGAQDATSPLHPPTEDARREDEESSDEGGREHYQLTALVMEMPNGGVRPNAFFMRGDGVFGALQGVRGPVAITATRGADVEADVVAAMRAVSGVALQPHPSDRALTSALEKVMELDTHARTAFLRGVAAEWA